MIRPAGRPFAAGVVVAAVLLVAVVSCRTVAPDDGDSPRSAAASSSFMVVQMNLCLSGLAGCFDATGYPDILGDAARRIQAAGPNVVTVNEACRRDAIRIARRTDYDVHFAPVRYAGAPLPCVDPGGRGLFGLAVLTRRPIVRSESKAFVAQAELEERRWLCVSTDDGVDVCTAHLENPDSSRADAANDAQCAELRRVLTRRASRLVLFGGDLNRRRSCAPLGSWSRTDATSDRLPGVQHVYGSPAFEDPVARVRPWRFSDHDLLLVSAEVVSRTP
ncbi:endonuclease/exonuclease/phosphatase family protein [Nocardioides terrigena]|uniref:endonuclease/exonuclease/phosphatase family protein n=1 Tax=Nocardioides terrigena TaxID=424797 RepID=UPI000D310898|nr:endonuclease/exonuclease/phosphatase family protein [Nocardioides terrigena]